MLSTFDMMSCPNLAVTVQTMQHVVAIESGYNPFAIGVVGGKLERQPRNRGEAVATARMLESKGYNFSLGIAQVNRNNLARYGLDSYEKAFDGCANLAAGSRILAQCYGRAKGDWGKAFSCYYSGNFVTGYRDGYVQRISNSLANEVPSITVYPQVREYPGNAPMPATGPVANSRVARRTAVRLVADAAAFDLVSTAAASEDPPGPPVSALAPVRTAPDPSRSSATTSTTRSIFVPRVSGPQEAGVSAAVAPAAANPVAAHQGQPQREVSDAAFVF